LKDLENTKENCKLRGIKHPVLKLHKYLMPNELEMNKEEYQLIFKLRSNVPQTKVNHNNRYFTYECEACKDEEETQEHVLKCIKMYMY
jgi:hypothetical protein